MLSKEVRLRALAQLLDARMQHTRWAAEVIHNPQPQVEANPDRCAFGRWLLSARGELSGLAEFCDLDAPHRELHQAYRLLRDKPGLAYHPEEIRYLSERLIEAIDRLEIRLNRAGAE